MFKEILYSMIIIILFGLLGSAGGYFGYYIYTNHIAKNQTEVINSDKDIGDYDQFLDKDTTTVETISSIFDNKTSEYESKLFNQTEKNNFSVFSGDYEQLSDKYTTTEKITSSMLTAQTSDYELNLSSEKITKKNFDKNNDRNNPVVNQNNLSIESSNLVDTLVLSYICEKNKIVIDFSVFNATFLNEEFDVFPNSNKKYFLKKVTKEINLKGVEIAYEDDIIIITHLKNLKGQNMLLLISWLDKVIQMMKKCENDILILHKFKLSGLINEILRSYIHERIDDPKTIEQIRFNEMIHFAKMFFYANKYNEKLKMQFDLIFDNDNNLVSFLYFPIIKNHLTEYDRYNETTRNYLKMRKDFTEEELKLMDSGRITIKH